MTHIPTLEAIRDTVARLAPHVIRTPTLPYFGTATEKQFGGGTDVFLKMELLQRTGSFKARGALNNVMSLTDAERKRGVAAFSAGNHAIAAAWAAQASGLQAKVAMPKTANPFRVQQVKHYGAEILFAEGMDDLMEKVAHLQEDEGRAMVHPFESPRTFEGTGGVGMELCEDVPNLDAVIVPVGGGGLISGVASAVHHMQPNAKIYGVEPEQADGMSQSLAAGEALPKIAVNSIADSLSAPLHLPQSFSIVRQLVERMVTVSDAAMADTMRLMFTDLKLAVEPACAAGLAALLGPLRNELAGKRVGIVLCGTNIDTATWQKFTA